MATVHNRSKKYPLEKNNSFKGVSKTPTPSNLPPNMLPAEKAEELRRKYNSFMEGGALTSGSIGNENYISNALTPGPGGQLIG